jgi:hypothetical protein
MASKPPIDVRALAKKGIFDEDRFFRLLSEQNNYVDPKTSKDFYMGLVRLITQELRVNGVARLPHLGDFALVKQKDHIGWAGKYQRMMEGKYVLKFYPKEIWRRYFHKLSESIGPSGMLDPREKILDRKL